MKRRTVLTLVAALTLSISLSACGDKTASQAEIPDTTGVEESTEEITEEAEEESTEEEETTPEISPEEKVQSALDEMPYYGDTSKCAMTAEQATAYAQLIADGLAGDFSFRGGYDERDNVRFDIVSWAEPCKVISSDGVMEWITETDRVYAILADFADDGNPYLYVYSSLAEGSFEIYGWAEDNAKLAFHAEDEDRGRGSYNLYEDDSDGERMKMLYSYMGGTVHYYNEYSFSNGVIEESAQMEARHDVDGWHMYEKDIEIDVYTEEEYQALWENNHNHTLSYTCFYDMAPCTLEEMINYLNAYATAMSDGQSVPVEIKKMDIVKHDRTGITTKGEVPQEKVNNLEILRKYIIGEQAIASGNADSSVYAGNEENFYFGLEDINNDGIQELILSDKHGEEGFVQIHFPPSYECLMNVWGFDSTNNTYMVSQGSVCIEEVIYTYDGTSFSIVSSLEGEWGSSEDGSPYTVTENGATREISREEFWTIENDWSNRHTRISPKSANIHLDIENIENTFQVKIDVQSSGEWLATATE